MQNDEHKGIKYLMKELDPSEAVLFEQRMMEDEDLLLEVECMRRTLRQLEKLPAEKPPRHLTEQIIRKACSCSKNKSNRPEYFQYGYTQRSYTKYYAAAALIVIGVGMGLMSLEYSGTGANNTAQQPRVSKVDIGGAPNMNNEASLGPWIDKNDIIYIGKPSNNRGETNFIIDSAKSSKDSFNPSINSNYWQDSPGLSNGSVRLTGSGR